MTTHMIPSRLIKWILPWLNWISLGLVNFFLVKIDPNISFQNQNFHPLVATRIKDMELIPIQNSLGKSKLCLDIARQD